MNQLMITLNSLAAVTEISQQSNGFKKYAKIEFALHQPLVERVASAAAHLAVGDDDHISFSCLRGHQNSSLHFRYSLLLQHKASAFLLGALFLDCRVHGIDAG